MEEVKDEKEKEIIKKLAEKKEFKIDIGTEIPKTEVKMQPKETTFQKIIKSLDDAGKRLAKDAGKGIIEASNRAYENVLREQGKGGFGINNPTEEQSYGFNIPELNSNQHYEHHRNQSRNRTNPNKQHKTRRIIIEG
jgi:hypothetical protein